MLDQGLVSSTRTVLLRSEWGRRQLKTVLSLVLVFVKEAVNADPNVVILILLDLEIILGVRVLGSDLLSQVVLLNHVVAVVRTYLEVQFLL